MVTPARNGLAAVAAAFVLVGTTGCTAGGDPVVRVDSGEGTFAFTPPPDAERGWWASFAWPVCVEATAGEQPVIAEEVELDARVEPLEVRAHVFTYAATSESRVTRGGFFVGLPVQREGDAGPQIVYPGDRGVAGTVQPLEGTALTTDCATTDDDPRAEQQYLAVSLRTDASGADLRSLRLVHRSGDDVGVSTPTRWDVIACGDGVMGREGMDRWCPELAPLTGRSG